MNVEVFKCCVSGDLNPLLIEQYSCLNINPKNQMSLRSCYEEAIDIYVNLKAKFEDKHKNNG